MHDESLRILDANLNRAREGLRVVEEYARFQREDIALSQRLKRLRHDLRLADDALRAALPEGLTPEAVRDTPGDVGTALSTPEEATRADSLAVARASMKRLQESLRVLEEYGKTLPGGVASAFESLRYAAYGIEPILLADATRRDRLRAARLYVLVTESLAATDAVTACREAVAGGADIIQMREKDLEDKAFLAQAEEMAAICRDGGALFLVNDRPHLAVLANADGVHTGQGDLPAHLTRRLIGPARLIGRSTCEPAMAEAALAEGADCIGVGPVHETNTKKHRAAVGLEYVRWAAENAKLPYFCIGGINRETVAPVLDAGAFAVAVCTGIIAAQDIAAEAAWFKEQVVARGDRRPETGQALAKTE